MWPNLPKVRNRCLTQPTGRPDSHTSIKQLQQKIKLHTWITWVEQSKGKCHYHLELQLISIHSPSNWKFQQQDGFNRHENIPEKLTEYSTTPYKQISSRHLSCINSQRLKLIEYQNGGANILSTSHKSTCYHTTLLCHTSQQPYYVHGQCLSQTFKITLTGCNHIAIIRCKVGNIMQQINNSLWNKSWPTP